MTCDDRSRLFSSWVETYTPEEKKALKGSTQVVENLMKTVGQKLKDAEGQWPPHSFDVAIQHHGLMKHR
jgi:hypothetical protein